MKKIYVIAVLFIFICSCEKNEKNIEKDLLDSSINKLKTTDAYNWVVILPSLGCTGCIQHAEAFMKDNVKNSSILFVLTKIESLKILQKKIGISIKEHTNIYVDRDDIFDMPTKNTFYPCIVKLNEGGYQDHGFQSPDNADAFKRLRAEIQAK